MSPGRCSPSQPRPAPAQAAPDHSVHRAATDQALGRFPAPWALPRTPPAAAAGDSTTIGESQPFASADATAARRATAARSAWPRLHTPRPRVRARGRAERRCSRPVPNRPSSPIPGPTPQSSAGPVHRWCPGPGAGKHHAGHLRRSTHRRWQLPWSQRAGHPARQERCTQRGRPRSGPLAGLRSVEPPWTPVRRRPYDLRDGQGDLREQGPCGPQVLGGAPWPLRRPDRRHPTVTRPPRR
jgi:hypothetical protein